MQKRLLVEKNNYRGLSGLSNDKLRAKDPHTNTVLASHSYKKVWSQRININKSNRQFSYISHNITLDTGSAFWGFTNAY